MLEQIAWNTFENTGSVEAYIFYRELEQETNLNKSNFLVECDIYEYNKNQRAGIKRSQ